MTFGNRAKKLLAANKALLVFFCLMMVFRSALADWMFVPTGSMNPTIVEGDRILVNKIAFGLRVPFTTVRLTDGSDPQRGDVVIFASPKDGKTTLVKRVIGVPGDSIAMRDEQLIVNGAPVDYGNSTQDDNDLPDATRDSRHEFLDEQLATRSHRIMILPNRAAARNFGPITVPNNQYLMLGDNRDNSEDSRYIGLVSRDAIVGRAFAVAYSLDRDHWYRPRFDRTFTNLQ